MRVLNNPAQPDTAILHSPFYIFNFLLYADIGAIMRLIEVNLLDIGIRLEDRFVERGGNCRYAEHAAAVRYQLAVLDGGAGVEYERVGHIVQTGDLLALFVGLRIAAGRHADAAGGIVRPLDVNVLELFVDNGIEDVEQVGVQSGQDSLRLRVAETA